MTWLNMNLQSESAWALHDLTSFALYHTKAVVSAGAVAVLSAVLSEKTYPNGNKKCVGDLLGPFTTYGRGLRIKQVIDDGTLGRLIVLLDQVYLFQGQLVTSLLLLDVFEDGNLIVQNKVSWPIPNIIMGMALPYSKVD
ncbi:hypothetical protein DAPPUDRAFT_336576 [Daphnia pulex]|uniref:Uncharacterized protein n=1 Tax=Daphnia pulex TaxID=6669 RepID=E9HZY2_DAPPU|nr:hypothetical protein DAPPUDRAFT_336576 [Daphnia pulex]|eukprot:EFX62697.1 hypothetical protein DAPPUDRAFT_336576 [Daphnia pulex]